ncbi:MAG: 4Fe-4S dicluster domain-containing protein [Vicinamibacteria bacterium]|nr:4Fe-4S dicluster domain-containing protein [Vicinamibacteria bacterium]
MSLIAKLREAALCLTARKATLDYPLAAAPALPEHFRGRPVFNAVKCIGCGGCANNCPAREILLFDRSQEVRVLKYLGRRCTYCGRCADLCPEKAITMSAEFETATNDIHDLGQEIEIFMGTCQRCGRCYKEPGPLDALMMKGYRQDDLERERWIYESKSFLDSEQTVKDIDIEMD